MKWLITKSYNQVNVYPDKDILPHRHNIDCPCKAIIIHMRHGDSMEFDATGETFVADGNVELVLHHYYVEGLTDN